MTDNEIIKALECCKGYLTDDCIECPYIEKYPRCDNFSKNYALDLINRQKAQIEKMRLDVECLVAQIKDSYMQIDVLNRKLNTAKTEAIKEFVERLKQKAEKGFWEEDN